MLNKKVIRIAKALYEARDAGDTLVFADYVGMAIQLQSFNLTDVRKKMRHAESCRQYAEQKAAREARYREANKNKDEYGIRGSRTMTTQEVETALESLLPELTASWGLDYRATHKTVRTPAGYLVQHRDEVVFISEGDERDEAGLKPLLEALRSLDVGMLMPTEALRYVRRTASDAQFNAMMANKGAW